MPSAKASIFPVHSITASAPWPSVSSSRRALSLWDGGGGETDCGSRTKSLGCLKAMRRFPDHYHLAGEGQLAKTVTARPTGPHPCITTV